VGLRTDLDSVQKRKFLTLPGLELRHVGRSALSQSLGYPGSQIIGNKRYLFNGAIVQTVTLNDKDVK
jgi:hypothetical protein